MISFSDEENNCADEFILLVLFLQNFMNRANTMSCFFFLNWFINFFRIIWKLLILILYWLPWSCFLIRKRRRCFRELQSPARLFWQGHVDLQTPNMFLEMNVVFFCVNQFRCYHSESRTLSNSDHSLIWEYFSPACNFAGLCSGSVHEGSAAKIFQWKPNKKIFETRIQERNPLKQMLLSDTAPKQFVYCWFVQPFCKARTDADVAEAHVVTCDWLFDFSSAFGKLTWLKNGP